MTEIRGQLSARLFQSGENYRSSQNLSARQALYAYKTPDHDLPGVVIDRIDGAPTRVLDVGCGNGNYTRRLREAFPEAEVVGVDLSPGMIEHLPEPTVVADIVDLPFDSDSADVVLAMHMLYHCPDIPAALEELERVLKPDGVLFVSTVADDDKVEYAALWSEAAQSELGADVGDFRAVVLDRFSLSTAQRMAESRFSSVRLHDLAGVIDLPEPEPLLSAYRSTASFVELDQDDFDAVMTAVEERLRAHFADHDILRITSHLGIIECRGPRPRDG